MNTHISMRSVLVTLLIGFATACASNSSEDHDARSARGDCAALVGTQLDVGGVVERAEISSAGESLQLDGAPIPIPISRNVCRVRAVLHPVEGSNIRAEIWLPTGAAWNGRFMATGSGGFAGDITGATLGVYFAVEAGYAGAGTDSGHEANSLDASWSNQNPVAVADWGYRANHVTHEAAKQLIGIFYGRAPEYSYFNGCSNGGREALMQAVRYPDDFDGIIVGAPAMGFTEVMSSFAWNTRAMRTPGATLSQQDLMLLNRAVLDRCDALDGVTDGVIEHPPSCPFDPAELRCTARNRGACLTDAQIATVQAIRQGPRLRTGEQMWPGLEMSAEPEWNAWINTPTAGQGVMSESFFRHMVYGDPNWTFDQFDLDRDYARANEVLGPVIDSDTPDLGAFFRSGGKMLMYTGWLDAAISPHSTINHYNAIRSQIGASYADDIRLFVVAGMGHCIGGPGASAIDYLGAVDRWVGSGVAPEQLIANRHGNILATYLNRPETVVGTRPVCAWPRRVTYRGSGSTDDAANFSCEAPQ